MKDDKKKIVVIERPPGISVNSTGGPDDVEREYYFPDSTSSDEIVMSATADIPVEIEQIDRRRLIETVDVAKTYVSEVEVGVTLKGGFRVRIKRHPKKIIKTFSEE